MTDQAPIGTYEILRHTKHVATAPRKCECGGTIPAGTRYNAFVGRADGKLETWRLCPYPCPNGDHARE